MILPRMTIKLLLLSGVFLLCGQTTIYAQVGCNFSCNDTINVSVNRDCEALITADMLLEGYNYGSCPRPPAPRIFDARGRVISNLLTKQYIGQYLKYEMKNTAQGTCWGYIKLEDKLPPQIVCPPNDTIKCNATDYAANNAALEARLKRSLENTIIDNCGNERLQISVISNKLSKECNKQFTATRTVTFVALDNHANADTCTFQVFYEGVPPVSVDAPKNYTQQFALNCTTQFPLNKEGKPYPTVEYLLRIDGGRSVPNINGRALANLVDGVFITDNLCNFKMSYSDEVIKSCGGSYKVIRNWRVIDWCKTNIPIDFYQIIKVEDKGLKITECSSNRRIAAGRTSCSATSLLPRPQIDTSECSDWKWSIKVRKPNTNSFVEVAKDLPSSRSGYNYTFDLGTSLVRYYVQDECDNIDSCDFRVEVVDDSPPNIACDQRTVVSLNDDFKARVPARSFDDESFDGCSEITYQVRRIDGGCSGNSLFKDYVEFCCEDLGKVIMVELRVTDAVGLFNTCMAEAVIQFEGDILDITCPNNRDTFDCRTFENFNFNSLTRPTIRTENKCVGNLTATPVVTRESIDACGIGFKEINWTIPHNGATRVVCSERFTFVNTTPFDGDTIIWPKDRTITSCDDLAPTDAEREAILPTNIPCANVIFSEPQDKVFHNISNACMKVLRTWTVVDWCRYPKDQSAIWTYTQTIIVKESESPTFAADVATVSSTYTASCSATVTLRPSATDDCTEDAELVWTRQLEQVLGVRRTSIVAKETGKNITSSLNRGTYIATWTVTDQCGKTTTATKEIEISDPDKPIALCKEYTASIDRATEVAIISVANVNDGSYDVCDDEPLIRIRRAGTNDPLNQEVILTCSDVGSVDIELVIQDEAGNIDQCIAKVNVNDANSVCAPSFFSNVLPCGHVIDLDGEDDYVTVPTLDITPTFTIEAYVYREEQDGNFVSLFEYGNDSPFIGFDGGHLTIFGQVKDDQVIPHDTWTHIAVTYDPDANRSGIYINGVLSELGAATTAFSGKGFAIAKNDSDTHFKGKLDEVRIWNRALTSAEIKANVPTIIDRKSEGLVAYYDFNAIAGVIIDRTDNGHIGTLHGLSGANKLPQLEKTEVVCPPDGSGANLQVTGRVATVDDISVERVNVTMSQRANNTTIYSTSDVKGDFAFAKTNMSTSYELSASKEDNLSNGVNIADLILLQRHVLGLGVIDNPYRLIAADLNGSKTLSGADIALLRNVILGNVDKLPRSQAWKFVPSDYEFVDPKAPFDFESKIQRTSTPSAADANNFIGVKMGDVNGSVVANSAMAGVRNSRELPLKLIRTEIADGFQWDIVSVESIDLSGLQLALPVHAGGLHSLKSGVLSVDHMDTRVSHDEWAMIWSDAAQHTHVAAGETLFSVVTQQGSMNVDLMGRKNEGVAVDVSMIESNIVWSVAENIGQEGLIVAQNIPNPFSHETSIMFQIGSDAEVSVTIYGLDGVRVYDHSQFYLKGGHEIIIDRNQTHLNKGIYYYQIKSHNRSLVRKMIVL